MNMDQLMDTNFILFCGIKLRKYAEQVYKDIDYKDIDYKADIENKFPARSFPIEVLH
jgi:hypothetical protein